MSGNVSFCLIRILQRKLFFRIFSNTFFKQFLNFKARNYRSNMETVVLQSPIKLPFNLSIFIYANFQMNGLKILTDSALNMHANPQNKPNICYASLRYSLSRFFVHKNLCHKSGRNSKQMCNIFFNIRRCRQNPLLGFSK